MLAISFPQYLTENNDFMVIGIIGPPGVGKSTIMNELYGYDASSPGTTHIYFLYVPSMCQSNTWAKYIYPIHYM